MQHSFKHFIKHTFTSIWMLHNLLALRSLTYISAETVLLCLHCAVTAFNEKHTWVWVTLQKYLNKCEPSKRIPSGLLLGVTHLWHLSYGTVSFEVGFFKLHWKYHVFKLRGSMYLLNLLPLKMCFFPLKIFWWLFWFKTLLWNAELLSGQIRIW